MYANSYRAEQWLTNLTHNYLIQQTQIYKKRKSVTSTCCYRFSFNYILPVFIYLPNSTDLISTEMSVFSLYNSTEIPNSNQI